MFQISYADMLTKVDPLRNELKSLEIEAQASRIKVRLLITSGQTSSVGQESLVSFEVSLGEIRVRRFQPPYGNILSVNLLSSWEKNQHCGINGKFHFCLFDILFKADEISHVIAELEKSIARYKEEYAALISQAQAIKADLAAVEAKVILGN